LPNIEWNRDTWGGAAQWHDRGDCWSKAWGGPERQWQGTILPRIEPFIPTGSILEIGPGFGRWTRFLKDACERLVVVDLNQRCIDACQERFSGESHIEYHTTDGKSLAMIPDESIDFVFSFDSLVHVERDVIDSYLAQLRQKMKKDAVAFIHHSNLAHYQNYFRWVRGIPVIRAFMRPFGFETRTHGRGGSVSGDDFAKSASQSGFSCIGQEWINWSSPLLIDCFSFFTKVGSSWDRGNEVVKNRFFMDEARCVSKRFYFPSDRRAA